MNSPILGNPNFFLQPPSTLVSGPSGSGKTASLATQLLSGIRTFVIVTEPDGVASLLDAATRLKAPIDLLHWTQCTPASTSWMDLESMITKVSSMDQKQLADQKDMGKSSFREPMMKILRNLQNFRDDRTGLDFGDYTTWTDRCSLNLDSLTGLCMIAWGCTVGFKPTANPGEWGIAQNVVQSLLVKLNSDRQCYFNMTTHVERETDEMTGAKKTMVSAIGAKLAPKIPPFFSEFVLASRTMVQGNIAEFRWSTLDNGMDLKNRALPISSTLKADFTPIIASHENRKKLAVGTGQASTQGPATGGPNATSPPSSAKPGAMPNAPLTPKTS